MQWAISVLTRLWPCGIPTKKMKWCIEIQANVPLMAHKFRSGATSKIDLVGNFSIDSQILQVFLFGYRGIHADVIVYILAH